MYTLYILKCADKTLYTGITTDLERRIKNTIPPVLARNIPAGEGRWSWFWRKNLKTGLTRLKRNHGLKNCLAKRRWKKSTKHLYNTKTIRSQPPIAQLSEPMVF